MPDFTLFNKSFIICLCSITLLCSCKKEENKTTDKTPHNNNAITTTKEIPAGNTDWRDILLKKYVLESSSPLIVASDRQKEEWLLDDRMITDTATYFVYHIGHDETDEDGENPRFATDQWVYIDSLSHQLYEYDLANDSLVKWIPKKISPKNKNPTLK